MAPKQKSTARKTVGGKAPQKTRKKPDNRDDDNMPVRRAKKPKPTGAMVKVTTDSDKDQEAPEMPQDAAPVNIENRLDHVPIDSGRDVERPWYYFDLVEPTVKARKAQTDVAAGRGPLVDNPEPNSLPAEVMGYA